MRWFRRKNNPVKEEIMAEETVTVEEKVAVKSEKNQLEGATGFWVDANRDFWARQGEDSFLKASLSEDGESITWDAAEGEPAAPSRPIPDAERAAARALYTLRQRR
jgi:hypothetical protein